MHMGRILIFCLVVGFFNTSWLFAQDEEFQKWLKQDQAAFKQFVEQEDREFAEFLKKDWQDFLTEQGLKPFPKPKPVKMPVASEKEKTKPKVAPKKIEKIPPPPPKPVVKPKPRPKPKPAKASITFDFYGAQLMFPKVKFKSLDLSSPLNNDKISNAWLTMASTKHKSLIKAIQEYRQQLKLNDWALLELVNKINQQILKGDLNQLMAYNWFVLNKLGYDAKVAFKEDKLFLLLPSSNTIFERPFVKINNQRYYFVSFDAPLKLSGKIRTYRGSFKNASKAISLNLKNFPGFALKPVKKTVRFQFNGQSYSLTAKYDQQVVQFLKNYPHTDLTVYFSAPASGELNYSLISQLRPMVQGKSELEAVNLLLRFVQTAFNYQTDDQQFGYEKCLLPDETLYYPSSDCEDRSILFAYLVRRLLGLQVIGLDYPNHIATAVRFRSEIPGASVLYNGQRYVICDPTYINADAGMVMPDFKDVTPKIIEFR